MRRGNVPRAYQDLAPVPCTPYSDRVYEGRAPLGISCTQLRTHWNTSYITSLNTSYITPIKKRWLWKVLLTRLSLCREAGNSWTADEKSASPSPPTFATCIVQFTHHRTHYHVTSISFINLCLLFKLMNVSNHFFNQIVFIVI